MMRRNKGGILLTAQQKWICCLLIAILLLSSAAMAAEVQESGAYPSRQYIYIVDCSGSMEDYEKTINIGREILFDLLPMSSTIIVAFNEQAFLANDGIQFGGNTSVLAGLRLADQSLEDIWSAAPNKEVTVILLSDMQSNVSAEDGITRLTEEMYEREAEEVRSIEARWSQYIQNRRMSFFSLRWESADDEGYKGVYNVHFSPADGNYREFNVSDIIKTCVEAYSCVLTGTDEFQWAEAGQQEGGSYALSLEESYRTFLYLPAALEQIRCPNGETKSADQISCWALDSGECLAMLENVQRGNYELTCTTMESIAVDPTETAVLCLQIPYPKFNIEISLKKPVCFSPITISANVTAGKSYLDYSGSSSCIMQIYSPEDDTPQIISAVYDEANLCYTASFTPQTPGEYTISATLYDLDSTLLMRTVSTDTYVSPLTVQPTGQTLRAYNALSAELQNMLVGQERSFKLSDYYSTKYQSLKFIVEDPSQPEVASWERVDDTEGQITVRANGPGVSELRYRIIYYGFDSDTPNASQEFTLTIGVVKAPVHFVRTAVIAACVAVSTTSVIAVFWYQRKHRRSKDSA